MRAAAISIMAILLLAPAPATAAPVSDQGPVIVSGAAGTFYGYLTPVMVVRSGGELTYANFDIVQHDVVHDVQTDEVANKKKDKWCKSFDKGRCPLFWSPRAGLGDAVQVEGLQNLKTGNVYTFYCTLHPGMKGRLVVAS